MKEQRCRWLDGCVVSPWKTEGQVKNWEDWSWAYHNSLEVVDWDGMVCDEEKWWGLSKEMYWVEVGRPVRRPIRTWLDSVEADMAELEIDKEDVHDRKKWRMNVVKKESTPIGKRNINQ